MAQKAVCPLAAVGLSRKACILGECVQIIVSELFDDLIGFDVVFFSEAGLECEHSIGDGVGVVYDLLVIGFHGFFLHKFKFVCELNIIKNGTYNISEFLFLIICKSTSI